MTVVEEAGGVRLHLSSRRDNRTGYTGVRERRGRFQVQHGPGRVYLGVFDTPVDAAVAYAQSVGESQPPPPAVATEAEGLRLRLSSSNSSGYMGVHKKASGRFQAEHMVDGRRCTLGTFDTAVGAAVAYARAVGQAEAAGAAGAWRGPPPWIRRRAVSEEGAEAMEVEPAAAETVVEEAGGVRLHLSSRNATGYMGVRNHSGRFQAEGPGRVYLGVFDTPVDAAVAYAQSVGESQPPPPAVATEAEGLRLRLSSSNSSGYMGVHKKASGRFQAEHMVDGRRCTLGTFDTAVGAAVAYARAVGRSALCLAPRTRARSAA